MISVEPMPSNDFKTLAERLEEGRLPMAEALRYAMLLAEELRKIHDAGKVHSAVTSFHVALTTRGLELLPAQEWSAEAVTPYTAPEVLHGGTPDKRSDIFSFGAVLFEMLTGCRAFDGEGRASLINRISNTPTPSAGSPALDRLLGPCLAKNPDLRTTRIQKVIMELKLLVIAACRAAQPATPGLRPDSMEAGAVRIEMQQMEARIAARLQAHEKAMIALQRSTKESVLSLRQQLTDMSLELSAAQSHGIAPAGEDSDGASSDRMRQIEDRLEEFVTHHAQFERSVAADLVDVETGQKLQEASIQSARTAMSQTDDLVERVVEALESLQNMVRERDGPAMENPFFAVNSVN